MPRKIPSSSAASAENKLVSLRLDAGLCEAPRSSATRETNRCVCRICPARTFRFLSTDFDGRWRRGKLCPCGRGRGGRFLFVAPRSFADDLRGLCDVDSRPTAASKTFTYGLGRARGFGGNGGAGNFGKKRACSSLIQLSGGLKRPGERRVWRTEILKCLRELIPGRCALNVMAERAGMV